MGILKGIAGFFTLDEAVQERDIGRNETCWCGSGKKYKKCHLDEDEQKLRAQRKADCRKT